MNDFLRATVRIGLLAVLVLAPLPFGSVRPGAVLTIEWTAAVLGLLAAIVAIRDPADVPRLARFIVAIGLALLTLGALQMVPVPDIVVENLAGPTADVRAEVWPFLDSPPEPSSLTLSPPGTASAWLRLAAYVVLAFAAAVSFTRGRHFRTAAIVVTASAAFQGLYGAYEFLSGHQHIFAYEKRHYLDSATGTFINRNHFAAYLAVALPVALWLAMNRSGTGRALRNLRERILHLSGASGFAVVFGGIAAGAIWAGVLLSRSRGGLAVALVSTVLAMALFSRHRRMMVIAGAVVLVPVALLMWQQVAVPGDRFATESGQLRSLNSRLPVWEVSTSITRDYPVVGAGMGTFEAVFELYRPPGIRGRWDRAHNDWLQLAVEMGWIAAILGLAGTIVVIRSGWRAGRVGTPEGLLAACIAAGITAAALHAAVDFPARIPAYAVQLAFLVGLLCALVHRVRDDDAMVRSHERRRGGVP